jgi:2-hydroxy-6-oxonona-2,4-dienedioate hydrolase
MTRKMSTTPGRRLAILAGALAGSLSAFAYARYRRDLRRARERVSTGGEVVQTACGPIEYEVAGDGPPVLLVHGAGGGFDQGMEFGEALAHSGFRIIAMSRFGYLHTPLPSDASAAAQADAHACLLDALGIERAAIVGASAGAPSSLQFALRHPQRCSALVLVVPAAYAPRPGGAAPLQTPRWTKALFDTALRSDFLYWTAIHVAPTLVGGAILATPTSVMQSASAEEKLRVSNVMHHVLPVSLRRVGLLNDASVVSMLGRYELERITTPTLIVGVRDCLFGTFEPARYTAEHIPGARFVSHDTGGHLWVGHHAELVREITAFLKENAASS